jgi:hypothetical protein
MPCDDAQARKPAVTPCTNIRRWGGLGGNDGCYSDNGLRAKIRRPLDANFCSYVCICDQQQPSPSDWLHISIPLVGRSHDCGWSHIAGTLAAMREGFAKFSRSSLQFEIREPVYLLLVPENLPRSVLRAFAYGFVSTGLGR